MNLSLTIHTPFTSGKSQHCFAKIQNILSPAKAYSIIHCKIQNILSSAKAYSMIPCKSLSKIDLVKAGSFSAHCKSRSSSTGMVGRMAFPVDCTGGKALKKSGVKLECSNLTQIEKAMVCPRGSSQME
jgi:hypothetical protein